MNNTLEIKFQQTLIQLLPEKTIYLPEHHTLVIADWHLGKLMHFRKNGLFVPSVAPTKEFEKIETMFQYFTVRRVILLGDLFHSELNSDWTYFINFLNKHSKISFLLTKGNHDILPKEFYAISNLEVVKTFLLQDVVFSHESIQVQSHQLNIIGHHHPGIRLHGKAKQSFTLPCFVLEKNQLIIPAFGEMTGLFPFRKQANNQIYVILGSEIIEYNP